MTDVVHLHMLEESLMRTLKEKSNNNVPFPQDENPFIFHTAVRVLVE
jgi:hypothetical protein